MLKQAKKTVKKINLVLILLISLGSTAAFANPSKKGVEVPMILRCFDHHGGAALKEGFGELPFVEGNGDIEIGNNKSAPIKFELYVNPDKLSWTIMFTLGDLHCVSAGGDSTFRPSTGEPEGPGI
jgi:ribosomal protein L24E